MWHKNKWLQHNKNVWKNWYQNGTHLTRFTLVPLQCTFMINKFTFTWQRILRGLIKMLFRWYIIIPLHGVSNLFDKCNNFCSIHSIYLFFNKYYNSIVSTFEWKKKFNRLWATWFFMFHTFRSLNLYYWTNNFKNNHFKFWKAKLW